MAMVQKLTNEDGFYTSSYTPGSYVESRHRDDECDGDNDNMDDMDEANNNVGLSNENDTHQNSSIHCALSSMPKFLTFCTIVAHVTRIVTISGKY